MKRTGPRRAKHERQSLECTTCGAGNRLAPGVLERGFQRCAHCGAAMPVHGAGSYAIDVNEGGFTRIVSPGRSELVMRLGRVAPLQAFVLVLILGDLFASSARHGFGRAGQPAVGWAITAVHVGACLALFALTIVEQRLLVAPGRVEAWWRLPGLNLRRRRLGTRGLVMRLREGRRAGLVLRSSSGRAVTVWTDGASEAAVLQRELAVAAREVHQPASGEAVRCPGCGAPVTTPRVLLERGGADCPHCQSGLVAVKGGVVLGECVVGLPESMAPEPVSRLGRPIGNDTVEWRLPSQLSQRPRLALTAVAFGVALGGGMAAGGIAMVLHSPWPGVALFFAGGLVPFGVGLAVYLIVSYCAGHRLRLDSTVLEHESRLGPLRVGRRLVALPRLLSLTVEQAVASVDLKARSATSETAISLPVLDGDGASVAREVVAGVCERLRSMERRVRSA